MRDYYVYVMTNKSGTLYTGVTNSLERRVSEHKRKLVVGFTSRYGITRLLYYEVYSDVRDAIAREKEIKKWRRSKKLAMVRSLNPLWRDLAEGWYSDQDVVGEGPDPSLRSGDRGLGPWTGGPSVIPSVSEESGPQPPHAATYYAGLLRLSCSAQGTISRPGQDAALFMLGLSKHLPPGQRGF